MFGEKHLPSQAQGLKQFSLTMSYSNKQEQFSKTSTLIPETSVPRNVAIIASHIVYKVKYSNARSLNLRAGIEPHGNRNSVRYILSNDFAICFPSGVHILEPIALMVNCAS